ncbi:MAG: GTP 3',8-cyclase MoaA [Clostridia bacterium]|nr:GTP 3',8-cyclase MoaA [Clostridia bacterium]
MKDSFGREISYLRISITQRCNLNCVYCGKDACAKKAAELPPEAYYTIAKAFAACGINKVRITGGEPLVRADVPEIVRLLRSIPAIETIALTTNAVYLKQYAAALKEAGLDRVNISLDSTDGSTYRHLTGADVLHKVMEGIEAAQAVNLAPIKINAVLMKGVNSDEAGDLIALTEKRNIDVRFIELMPFSEEGKNACLVVTGEEILQQYPFLHSLELVEGTAKYYAGQNYAGRVGFINPMSRKFCGSCNRMRLLCDGKVKPCLGDDALYDLLPFLEDEAALIQQIKTIISKKPAGHHFEQGATERGMNRIGG